MEDKKTTYDLVGNYIDLMTEHELGTLSDEEVKSFDKDIADIESELIQKKDNLHWVMTNCDEQKSSIEGMMDMHDEKIQKLRKKRNAIQNTTNRIKELTMLIVDTLGNNNKNGNKCILINGEKYTNIMVNGSLELKVDEEDLPDEFKEYRMKVNKSKVRKHVIKKGGETNYAKVDKKRSLRIT
jgi:hypothetical protein|tara:strand:- start:1619 stop:2167 length:549 start_codon:yes stop_codon:yes gene_type:complete